MKSLWSEADAAHAISCYGAQGVSQDLALRTYSARLLGAEPELVLHGGGNTSVKTVARDLFGDELDVLCVKGSGWDLATIEPAGHPAVRLEPLRRLRGLERLTDEEMVNVQRSNLLDSTAPNPSVETLLHAFLPAKFIDHSHATAFLALADQPDAEAVIARVYDGRIACVPYVMPGFALARLAARTFEADPGVEGLALIRHGLFTFGESARESYERMIEFVSMAEAEIARRAPRKRIGSKAPATAAAGEVLPILRGLMGSEPRWVFDLRCGEEARSVVDSDRLADWAARGVATPDHVIRTKRFPLIVERPSGDLAAWRVCTDKALSAYRSDYEAYFARNSARSADRKKPLDSLPRVVAIPGVGLAGMGRTAGEAAVVGDIAEAWAGTLLAAEQVGRFEPVGEADTFDMEYWSLEQAKLGKRAAMRLEGRIVAITGAAGSIGSATARAFAAEGAALALIDRDGEACKAVAGSVSPRALAIMCDVTDPQAVEGAFARVCAHFGGLDIVVSNAGTATAGAMVELSDTALRESFEINFFSHQHVARAAIGRFRAQGLGGVLLFNVSKQAINPGPDFGAYGTSKSALLALIRQYAIEHGAEGVRVNALNPDRIRSGLLTGEMIARRAAARGVSETAYMAGNLLGAEVTPEDVAQAFIHAAMLERTTGAVIPVDGGNAAAMLR